MSAPRRFDCRDFELLLAGFVEGRLEPSERDLAERHLADCADCRELAALARQGDGGPAPLEIDQTDTILARTSGAACGRFLELADSLSGGTGPGDGESGDDGLEAELARRHLARCPACRRIAATLAWLLPLLPSLAEEPAPAELAPRVLAATSGRTRRARPGRNGLAEALRAWGREILRRPRISWEAAYVGAVLAVMVLGAPWQLAGAARRGPDWASRQARRPLAVAATRAGELEAAAQTTAAGWLGGRRSALTEEWESMRDRVSGPARDLESHGRAAGRALRRGDWIEAVPEISNVWNDLAQIWRQARGRSGTEANSDEPARLEGGSHGLRAS